MYVDLFQNRSDTEVWIVLAALQLTLKRNPELCDKFILCQVPCYTENEDSLRRTIDSLSALNCDDKRKLVFLICDGLIINSGNDKPTSRIVLDILGVDPSSIPSLCCSSQSAKGLGLSTTARSIPVCTSLKVTLFRKPIPSLSSHGY
jgi:hypothetical protein